MNAHLILLILAGSIGYGIWAYSHPWRPCPWCKGKGSNRGSTRRRSGRCRLCGRRCPGNGDGRGGHEEGSGRCRGGPAKFQPEHVLSFSRLVRVLIGNY